MDYDEVWGIDYSRVRDFFDAQTDVVGTSEGGYCFGGAEITVTRLPDKAMGSLHFARTKVTICGKADADEIHKRFFMRFLSAGG